MENKEIIKIDGGMGEDNDVQVFGDYYATLLQARKYLKDPITIRSDHTVEMYSHLENQFQEIAVEYSPEEVKKLKDLGLDGGKRIKKVVIDEGEYIMSRKWVKNWIIDNKDFDYNKRGGYILQFTDGETVVETGTLTLT